jgi:hypothetical protein
MKQGKKIGKTDTVKTTIRINRDLWKAVMHRSIDEDRSLQDIVELALEAYLHRK